MKPLVVILWIQVLAGLACMFIAFGEMHSGAMSYEWTNELRADYKKRAESAGFKSPPDIAGVKHQQLPEALHFYAQDNLHLAGYWFFFSGGVTAAGAVMLFLAYRVRKQRQL